MSDYQPTITVQYRDYAAARKEKKRTGYYKAAPLITEVRPNPLSMELRIVLGYFWEIYDVCMEDASGLGGTEKADHLRQMRLEEAQEALADVRNLCFLLFSPASVYSHIHVHSEHGCNDETCPAWVRGGTAARDNVADWYTPDC